MGRKTCEIATDADSWGVFAGPDHINEKKLFFSSTIVFLFCRRLHSMKLSIHTNCNCHHDD